jgi:hypothetical protein
MSLINGDKSRSHRERKQNIHRRLRTKELLAAEMAKAKQAENGTKKKAMSSKDPA